MVTLISTSEQGRTRVAGKFSLDRGAKCWNIGYFETVLEFMVIPEAYVLIMTAKEASLCLTIDGAMS